MNLYQCPICTDNLVIKNLSVYCKNDAFMVILDNTASLNDFENIKIEKINYFQFPINDYIISASKKYNETIIYKNKSRLTFNFFSKMPSSKAEAKLLVNRLLKFKCLI